MHTPANGVVLPQILSRMIELRRVRRAVAVGSKKVLRIPRISFRKLRREEEARRVAEEKTESLQETAKTGADEVTHLRKRRRELEAKNAELT